jgi:hypothetical protein
VDLAGLSQQLDVWKELILSNLRRLRNYLSNNVLIVLKTPEVVPADSKTLVLIMLRWKQSKKSLSTHTPDSLALASPNLMELLRLNLTKTSRRIRSISLKRLLPSNQLLLQLKLLVIHSCITLKVSLPILIAVQNLIMQCSLSDMELKMVSSTTSSKIHGELIGEKRGMLESELSMELEFAVSNSVQLLLRPKVMEND